MEPNDSELRRSLDDALQTARRRLRSQIVVGLGLLVWIAIWGVWAHSRFQAMTAQEAAAIARDRIERALPDARRELARTLAQRAPDLAHRAAQRALAAPGELRSDVEDAVLAEIDRAVDPFQNELSAALRQEVGGARAELDRRLPGASDRERLEAVVAGLDQAWGERLDELETRWRQPFSSSVDELGRQVADLASPAEPAVASVASRRESLQRDLLIAFLELSSRAAARGDLDALADPTRPLPGR